MYKLYSFKLFSHKNPDKLLFEHLNNTANLSKEIINGKFTNLDNIKKENLLDVSYIIGFTHDLGKATRYFQEYLNEKDEKMKISLKNNPETHHSFLSSIFCYYFIKNYTECRSKSEGIIKYLPIISYIIVKRHHGYLHNAPDEFYFDDDQEVSIIKQLQSIDYEELQNYLDLTLNKNNLLNLNIKDISKNILSNYKNDIFKKEKKTMRADLNANKDLSLYFIMQLLYSILLNADKTDVILNKEIFKEKTISSDMVDKYKEKKFKVQKNEIDKIKNDIYKMVINKAVKLSLNDRIFSLNVPTGTGKTLTSLSFALKLRERIKKEMGFSPKIIYSLPFLSIIEQNFNVFEDLFLEIDGKLPDTSLLLKHHHLSDVSYKIDNNEFEIDEAKFLIEGWNSEIIVTTFWQFFHTLFSNKNSLLLKFHNIINSIIILDEVQSIPHKYWLLIRETLKFMAQKLNSYIIFVTATQPLIFEKSEIKELVENKEKYFKRIDRINLNVNLKTIIPIDKFKCLIKDELEKNSTKHFLIILNTVKSSIIIYNFLKNLNLKTTRYYYLSTNIIPKTRFSRIEEIRKISEFRKVIVSTQLIEAGVDFDVDIVFRDFAPLDSINQSAGRCNRNNLKDDKGLVHIFILKDDKKEYYKYIYDAFLISKTTNVFKNKDFKNISESQILELNKNYFLEVKEGMSNDKANEYLKYLYTISFENIGNNFKLIEEDYFKTDIFVEIDEEAKKIWKKYLDIKKIENTFNRKKEFLKIKKTFYEYIISINKKFCHNLYSEECGIGYIPFEEVKEYYDPETGFKIGDNINGSLIV